MTRITVLIEDTPAEGSRLRHEHGLSYWIETDDGVLLFDTGASDRAVGNAQTLSFPVESLETVVISHSHYDHGDGLPGFLSAASGKVDVHVSSGFFLPKYSRKESGPDFKGLGYDREWLEERSTVHVHSDPVTSLSPSVDLVRSFPRKSPLETNNPRFIVPRDDTYVVDDFSDEQLVVVSVPEGLLVVVGCSHPGIMNMVQTVEERYEKPIYGVIGGFHLIDASDTRIEETVTFFRDRAFPMIAPCHCTGKPAIERLGSLPGFRSITCGTVLNF